MPFLQPTFLAYQFGLPFVVAMAPIAYGAIPFEGADTLATLKAISDCTP